MSREQPGRRAVKRDMSREQPGRDMRYGTGERYDPGRAGNDMTRAGRDIT